MSAARRFSKTTPSAAPERILEKVSVPWLFQLE
jgi:hypothetical protein